MKKYFQEATHTFNENRGLFLSISLVLGIILGLATFVGLTTGTIILIIFLLLPFVVSIYALCMKAGDNREVINKDLYFGFKNFLTSVSLATKMLVKPILIGILIWFLISSVGYSCVLFYLQKINDPIFTIIESGNMEEIMKAMTKLVTSNPWFVVINYVSMAASFIVGFNIYIKRTFAPFVCFETTFTLDSAKKISINLNKQSKNYRLMNNLFLIMYIVLFAIMELLSTLFYNINVNFSIMFLIDVLVVFILMAPLILLHTLANFHYYDDNHRENIKRLYKEYLNVASRTTDSKMIDEEFKKSDENNESKSE